MKNERGFLDEDQIAVVLPVVSDDEYFISPDIQGLRNMLQGDPKALQNIYGFTVGRKGYGKVKLLEAVDVERAKICEIFKIKRGELSERLGKEVNRAGNDFMSESHPCQEYIFVIYQKKVYRRQMQYAGLF